jgi:hypothetical protein
MNYYTLVHTIFILINHRIEIQYIQKIYTLLLKEKCDSIYPTTKGKMVCPYNDQNVCLQTEN